MEAEWTNEESMGKEGKKTDENVNPCCLHL